MNIKEALEHPRVSYVVANERMRIWKLLDSIVTNNQSLNATNQFVCSNTNPGGKQYNFEKCVAYLIPVCSIALKKIYNKSPMAAVDSINVKNNKGCTGVELRYYKSPEFTRLPKDQKYELGKWRKTDEGTTKFATGRKADPDWKDGKRGKGGQGGCSFSTSKKQKKEMQKLTLSSIGENSKEESANMSVSEMAAAINKQIDDWVTAGISAAKNNTFSTTTTSTNGSFTKSLHTFFKSKGW